MRTAPTSVNVGGSLVDELGRDYKEFKKLHPERTARIPLAIKQKAKDVLDGGSTLGDIAKATGLAVPTVTRWIDSLGDRAYEKKKASSKVENSPQGGVIVIGNPEAPEPSMRKLDDNWIKVRIKGLEIEVAKEDFWALLAARF